MSSLSFVNGTCEYFLNYGLHTHQHHIYNSIKWTTRQQYSRPSSNHHSFSLRCKHITLRIKILENIANKPRFCKYRGIWRKHINMLWHLTLLMKCNLDNHVWFINVWGWGKVTYLPAFLNYSMTIDIPRLHMKYAYTS